MPAIQTPEQFVEDFVKTAEKAKKKIYLQSMVFERGTLLAKLEPVLIRKAQEGLDVQVTIDWVFQRYVEDTPNLAPILNPKLSKHGATIHQETYELINRWEQAGIKFTITNVPNYLSSLIPIAGRNHIKIYIIDETAAWMGGVNLFDTALKLIDFLVKFADPTIIDALSKQYFKVNEHKPRVDYNVACTKEEILFVDSGIKGQSLIFTEAIQLIRTAKKTITFASQFLPDGKLLKELFLAANKGVSVTIITSSRETRTFNKLPYSIPYQYLKRKIAKSKHMKLIHREKRVHAKLLIVDKSVAFFGSHNMTNIGVQLGTEEIAMRTTDKKLVAGLEQFINNTPSPKR